MSRLLDNDLAIKKVVTEEYNIQYLLHFTQAENLESIFQVGLLPVNQFEETGVRAKINDPFRFDYCAGATSLSIHFPNYKLFYKFREQNRSIDWAILALEPSILWEKKCAFCTDNAANSHIANIPIKNRMGVRAFTKMYDEIPNKPSRKVLGILNQCPTNPQAEVLTFGEIEPKYIGAVLFKDDGALNKYKAFIPIESHSEMQIEVVDGLFSARQDYIHW